MSSEVEMMGLHVQTEGGESDSDKSSSSSEPTLGVKRASVLQFAAAQSARHQRRSSSVTDSVDIGAIWTDVLTTYGGMTQQEVSKVATGVSLGGLPPPSSDAHVYLTHEMLKEIGLSDVGTRCKVMLACRRMPRHYKFVPPVENSALVTPVPSDLGLDECPERPSRAEFGSYERDPEPVKLRVYATRRFTWYDLKGKDRSPEVISSTPSQFDNALEKLRDVCESDVPSSLIEEALAKTQPLPQLVSAEDRPHEGVLILRQCSLPVEADQDDMASLTHRWTVYVDMRRNIVATIHRLDSMELAELRDSFHRRVQGMDLTDFLILILERSVMMYQAGVALSEACLDDLESHMLSNSAAGDDTLKNLFHLQRRGSVYDRLVGLTQSMLLKELGPFFGIKEDVELAVSSEFDPTRESMTLLLSRSRGLLDIHLSLVGFRTNELMKNLTKVSLLFTPLSFIAGFYGMNFQNMPELALENSYFVCVAGMVAVAIGMLVWMRANGL